jgi:hypothetical protein
MSENGKLLDPASIRAAQPVAAAPGVSGQSTTAKSEG